MLQYNTEITTKGTKDNILDFFTTNKEFHVRLQQDNTIEFVKNEKGTNMVKPVVRLSIDKREFDDLYLFFEVRPKSSFSFLLFFLFALACALIGTSILISVLIFGFYSLILTFMFFYMPCEGIMSDIKKCLRKNNIPFKTIKSEYSLWRKWYKYILDE